MPRTKVGSGRMDEAAVHRLGDAVVDHLGPHLPVEQLGVVRPGGSRSPGEVGAGASSIAASRSAASGSVSAPASHSR